MTQLNHELVILHIIAFLELIYLSQVSQLNSTVEYFGNTSKSHFLRADADELLSCVEKSSRNWYSDETRI